MLEVHHLIKYFKSGLMRKNTVCAVNDVSFSVAQNEIFGLIGGSGSGKTTTSRIIMGLLRPDAGSVVYNGQDLMTLKKRQWRHIRQSIQMIFQNPQMTFNPRFTVYDCCAEPIRLYGLAQSKKQERSMVFDMLESVGISADQFKKYPHEISGGQAQRISLVRSLILEPQLLICDEPTSMLDVSVQAQIISLIKREQQKRKISVLYISHDLDTVRALCDRVAVMKAGKVVEKGRVGEVFVSPQHPYTQKLLASSL